MKWLHKLKGAVAFAMVLLFFKPIQFALQRFGAITGQAGNVKIGTTAVAEIDNWKLNISAEMLESTDFDSDGWKEFIAGLKEWSGSFSGNWDMTDTAGQLAMQGGLIAGTLITLRLDVDGTHYYSGSAFIKSGGIETPVGGKVTVSFDFQGTGALTPT